MSNTPIMRYFDHRHLKEGPLRDVSKEYTEMAQKLDKFLPAGPEKSEALRDLLKSKDSAVRAALDLTSSHQRAVRIPDDPNGFDEGAEELPSPSPVDKGVGGRSTGKGDSTIDIHYDTLPNGVTVNVDHPSTGAGSIKSLSDIEMAQTRRLQARRTHGY